MKRHVGLATLFRLVKDKRPYGILAGVFVMLSFGLMLFILLFWVVFKNETGSHDYDEIKKYGLQKDAKITYLKTVNNISINDEHPVIISYEYDDDKHKAKDKFETLDLENIASFNVGTVIKILVYNHQSMIKDIEPYDFPNMLFYVIPLPFFIAGLILLLVALIPALKTYNLYKFGIIKEAIIVSIGLNNGTLPFSNFKGKFAVRYYFINEHLNKISGENEPKDLLFLMGKKPGDAVKVFVSEKNENISHIIPSLEAVKNNWDLNTPQFV